MILGILAAWLWMASQMAWQTHQDQAFVTGVRMYESLLQTGRTPPAGITIEPPALPPDPAMREATLPPIPDGIVPARITSVSVLANSTDFAGTRVQFYIVSPDLRYPVSDITVDGGEDPAVITGNLIRLVASYCSDPVIFARVDANAWQRIDGLGIWGCQAAPRDYRLLAIFVLGLGIVIILSQITEAGAQFTQFANALKKRGQFSRREAFQETGPEELREIVRTVNDHLAFERDRLDRRAMVLSGVSHDLGTPATRLRLRTALIEDHDLRDRLEADIDQMTEMIDSALTYTRTEINLEEMVQVSLTSLVEAIVADYEDIGKPVQLQQAHSSSIEKSRSVFGGGGQRLNFPAEDARRILVMARPLSLRRAISNLIDNSLKYGRRARVSVVADAEMASVMIEDEGMNISEEMLDKLTAPFIRGDNTGLTEGVGLGLTIVSTIARQHGGGLSFERLSSGMRAVLKISRA